MNKKRSPRKIIEAEEIEKGERAYLKFPGKELIPVTDISRMDGTVIDYDKVLDIFKQHQKPYAFVHTHIDYGNNPSNQYPSRRDLDTFLTDPLARSMVIATLDRKNKKIKGYFVLRKTKKTPLNLVEGREPEPLRLFFRHPIINKDYTSEDMEIARKEANDYKSDEKHLKELSKKLNLQYRLVPSESYEVRTRGIFRRKKYFSKKLSAIIGIVGLGSSLFFLSSSISGNVIGLNQTYSNLIGVFLFIIGIIGAFVYFKNFLRNF